MKVSFIKFEKDKNSFKLPENLGFDVFSLNKNINVDNKIDELINNNYNTIIITKDVARLSNKINNEYKVNNDIEIIIAKKKKD